MAAFRINNEGMPRTPAHLAAIIPDNEPAELSGVLIKMGVFTLAMVILPIGSYFLSRDYYFGEAGTTGAGITAATVANLVLAAFVWVAFREDIANPPETKKAAASTAVKPAESKKKK